MFKNFIVCILEVHSSSMLDTHLVQPLDGIETKSHPSVNYMSHWFQECILT